MKTRKTTQTVGEYSTLSHAAYQLGISYWQIYRLVQRQRVSTFRVGNTLLVRLSDVKEAAAKR
jgi:excisionase family DNA binding protein